MMWFIFFFFQAEDGIRDLTVTGVQTCALPIFEQQQYPMPQGRLARWLVTQELGYYQRMPAPDLAAVLLVEPEVAVRRKRSEERRVGKEGRSRWSPYH